MNAIGVASQQNVIYSGNSKAGKMGKETSIFKALLSTEKTGPKIPTESPVANEEQVTEQQSFLATLPVSVLEGLYKEITGENSDVESEDLVILLDELLSQQGIEGELAWGTLIAYFQGNASDDLNMEEIGPQIVSLFESWSLNEDKTDHYKNPIHNLTVKSLDNLERSITIDASVQKEISQLISRFDALLNSASSEQDVNKISAKVLELLEKWSTLMDKVPTNTNAAITTEGETKEQNLWKELANFFQRRSQLASNQQYNSNAEVTSKDISKWLTQALQGATTVENTAVNPVINLTAMPLSKVEQYVIYMNQAQNTEQAEKQLMDQFQNVIKSSRFLSSANRLDQLSIRLRPDNMGEMMIRFTQINGEMAVKIIVSSQAARKMLEGNMHQLKHMFSPQQVVIEEREIMVQEMENGQEERLMDDQDESDSQHSKQKDKSEDDDTFATHFQELLLNEKV